MVSYMAFVLLLFLPILSFFGCLGKALCRDCGISWETSLVFVLYLNRKEGNAQESMQLPNTFRFKTKGKEGRI